MNKVSCAWTPDQPKKTFFVVCSLGNFGRGGTHDLPHRDGSLSRSFGLTTVQNSVRRPPISLEDA